MLDHHCCHEHPSNTHHRQHVVQQQLLQLQQQLQQAAGHSAIDSLQQVSTSTNVLGRHDPRCDRLNKSQYVLFTLFC